MGEYYSIYTNNVICNGGKLISMCEALIGMQPTPELMHIALQDGMFF